MITFRKKLKLGKSFLESKLHPLPIWTHLWVTDRCNLSCDYCYVVDNKSSNPKKDEVKSWISHADHLGSAIVAFMGGEPTLRKDLPEIVASADERNMITYATTNGKLLTYQKLEDLARAGLDVLELSLDGYDLVDGSKKSLNGDETLIEMLEQVRGEYGLKFKIHQVLAPSTLEETPKLLELSKRRGVPISFGLVYHHLPNEEKNHQEKFKKTLNLILEKRKNGTPIINPTQYFTDGITSLDSSVRIDCDVGLYMVQVATDGSVYVCSKLTTKKPIKFLEIDNNYFKDDQHGNQQLLEQCADKCFSACAYTTSFFRQHPLSLISAYKK